MPSSPEGKRKPTKKVLAFLKAMFGEAKEQPVLAAKLAGYPYPRSAASRLLRTYADLISAKRGEWRAEVEASAEEVRETLTKIARDPISRDRMKALELLGRMHGQFSDKIDVTLDKRTIIKEIRESLKHAQSRIKPA